MANHGISWVPGAHVRFGSLDFIITVGGELALAHAAIQSLPSISLNHERLERQLGISLGPNSPGRTSAASPFPTPTTWHGLLEEDPSLWNTTYGAPR